MGVLTLFYNRLYFTSRPRQQATADRSERPTPCFMQPDIAFQMPEFNGNLHVLTDHFVHGAHAAGIYVLPKRIDDPADMQRFIDIGADGISTERPDVMLALPGRYGRRPTAPRWLRSGAHHLS